MGSCTSKKAAPLDSAVADNILLTLQAAGGRNDWYVFFHSDSEEEFWNALGRYASGGGTYHELLRPFDPKNYLEPGRYVVVFRDDVDVRTSHPVGMSVPAPPRIVRATHLVPATEGTYAVIGSLQLSDEL
jgi:hypothetical protein